MQQILKLFNEDIGDNSLAIRAYCITQNCHVQNGS